MSGNVVDVLVDDCENLPCIRCNRTGYNRHSHYNGFRAYAYGKGLGIKCDDIAQADFCDQCDELFSEKNYHLWPGGSQSRERSEEFQHWIIMSIIRRAVLGRQKAANGD